MTEDKEQQLEQEIEAKIREMEDEAYVFPKRMKKWDYIWVILVIFLCFVFCSEWYYLWQYIIH